LPQLRGSYSGSADQPPGLVDIKDDEEDEDEDGNVLDPDYVW
jgi:hypothetical protein